MNDVRYALRTMKKSPVFSAAAILTLALGIGATTAIFSVVNAVILRPLPFADPERLIRIYEKNDRLNLPSFSSSVPNYLSWKEQTQTFQELGLIGFAIFNLSGTGDPEQFSGNPVSPSLSRVLGIQPVAGRFFRDEEERPGAAPVAIISEGLWRRRFGGDRGLIGQSIVLNGTAYTVVGVAPPAMNFLTHGEIWVPYIIEPSSEARLNHVTAAVGRLKSGISIEQAQAEMDTIAHRVGMQYPETKDWGVQLQTFDGWIVGDDLRRALWVLLASVGAVLMIACANVANLLLSRAASREKEIAIRTALGAGKNRLIGQLLAESVLLSLIGGAAGLIAAVWAVGLMSRSLPANLLPVNEITIDASVLWFALTAAVATGILFGLAPALQSAGADLNNVLKQGGRSSSGGRPVLRRVLIAGELAIATVLLIGAGLLMQSLLHLQGVRVGFKTEKLLTFQVAPSGTNYSGISKIWTFYDSLLESIRSIPGVREAAASSGIPFGAGIYNTSPAQPVGPAVLPPSESIPVDWRIITPRYFEAMQIPVLRGREFTAHDNATAPPTLIISQKTAENFWGTMNPIGRVVRLTSSGSSRELTVIGVVGDVVNKSLGQPTTPAMYISAAARTAQVMDVVVRTEGDPLLATAAVRRKLQNLDAELAMSNIRSMDQWISTNAARPRLNSMLIEVFSAIALLIGAIGIYGVVSYSVSQQTREIGVRVALGASRSHVVALVLREGMIMAIAGIAVGLAAAFGLSRVLASLLFGVRAHDPTTFVSVALILMSVATAACWAPALKASRVDPAIALKGE